MIWKLHFVKLSVMEFFQNCIRRLLRYNLKVYIVITIRWAIQVWHTPLLKKFSQWAHLNYSLQKTRLLFIDLRFMKGRKQSKHKSKSEVSKRLFYHFMEKKKNSNVTLIEKISGKLSTKLSMRGHIKQLRIDLFTLKGFITKFAWKSFIYFKNWNITLKIFNNSFISKFA